jgi:hypothetical protein
MDTSLPDSTACYPDARLRKGWAIVWLMVAITWGLVIILLLNIPTDPKNREILGYSLSRLALISLALVLSIGHLFLSWIAIRRPGWRRRVMDIVIIRLALFKGVMIGALTFAMGLWLSVLITNGFTRPGRIFRPYTAYYERLFPFLAGLFLECLILVIGITILKYGFHYKTLCAEKRTWLLAAGITGILLLTWLFMASTGIGITPDKAGWGSPGVPILFYQYLFTWLAGLGLFFSLLPLNKKLSSRQNLFVDGLICLTLWAAAVWSWSNQDVQRSYFLPSPKPPNFEYYPYSDAGFYDYNAQSLLLGYGFLNGQVVPRPLYILLLAGFHAIAGQDYEQTIYIQTLFLALLPIFLYLLGKTLHSRALGIIIAVLAIIREVNSILATPWVEVSHSKLFMADLMTTTAIIALAWLAARWFSRSKNDGINPLLTGGMLGVTTLLRTQSILLFPVLLLIAGWYYQRDWKSLGRGMMLFGLGVFLVVSPWLARNYMKTGALVFDDPTTQNALVAQRYSSEMGAMPARFPNESQSQYAERLSASIRQFLVANPGLVANFVTAHSLNSLVSTIMVLPMRFSIDQRCDTLDLCTPFWTSLINLFTAADRALLLLNLFIISIGLASSWRRWRWTGLIPLMFLLTYSFSNAIARNSARRYILPVDWVSYFYFITGLFEIAFWIAIVLGVDRVKIQAGLSLPAKQPVANQRNSHLTLGVVATLLLMVGLSIPAAEWFGRPYYFNQEKATLWADLAEKPGKESLPVSLAALDEFVEQSEAVILKGRAFYPRYYEALDGEPGSGWPAYKPYEYRETGKLGFIVIGPTGATQVNVALDETPINFPNAVDVMVLGCQEEGYVDALWVDFLDQANQSILRSKLIPLACPLK